MFLFPEVVLGQVEETWIDVDSRVYRTPASAVDPAGEGRLSVARPQVKPVVPVRFVQACVRAHISDIDWYGFVRRDYKTERTGDLWFDEGGAAGQRPGPDHVRDEKNGQPASPAVEAAVQGRPYARVL